MVNILGLMLALNGQPGTLPLEQAIVIVESGGDNTKVGKAGERGMYQIRKICVDDCNRIIGKKKYTYNDRLNPVKSGEMFFIYTSYYGKRYERETGKKLDDLVRAQIWNGGTRGWRVAKTKRYVAKIKEVSL